MGNIDPALINAMKLDAPSWKVGDEDSIVVTSSGSVYHVDREGTLTGGSYLTEGRTAELRGAVYRSEGPIRPNRVVVGLGIEAMTTDGKVLVTSPVRNIEPVPGTPT